MGYCDLNTIKELEVKLSTGAFRYGCVECGSPITCEHYRAPVLSSVDFFKPPKPKPKVYRGSFFSQLIGTILIISPLLVVGWWLYMR